MTWGSVTPYYYVSDGRKEAFIRSGNQSIPAPTHILQNLILKGKNITFDSLPSEYNIGDLSFTLLNATIKERTGKKFDKNKDFALALGMGEITINRLENGSTQSGAVDSIIRLSENPENMLELIERNR